MADVGDNVILSWVGELDELEQQIEDLQTAKRDFYAGIRDQHGKATAAGLKAAMRVHRMDSEKRLAADEVDDEAQRILSVIENGPSRTRAPRATREAPAPLPPHDPETGEVDEPAPIDPKLIETVVHGVQTEVGRKALIAAIDIMIEREERQGEHEPFTPPAFLSGERKPLRPHCQNPGNCSGYGRNHCHTCGKTAETEAA